MHFESQLSVTNGDQCGFSSQRQPGSEVSQDEDGPQRHTDEYTKFYDQPAPEDFGG